LKNNLYWKKLNIGKKSYVLSLKGNYSIVIVILYIILIPIISNAQAIILGLTRDVTAPQITTSPQDIITYDAGSSNRNCRIIPGSSAVYTIQTTGGVDVYGTLYDSGGSILADNDDGGTNLNFLITWSLTAGQTYYLSIYNFDGNGLTSTLNITGGTILPVELNSFNAIINGSFITLNWQTATEVNNYGFSLERRVKNEEWKEIGFVKGNGNNNSPKEYSFTDYKVSGGKYSYRLKQLDNDGKYEYSKVVEVTLNDQPKTFELSQNYPNPFNPSTIISYQLAVNSKVSLKIYNFLGEEIETLVDEYQQEGFHSLLFTIHSSLPSGIYFCTLNCGNYLFTQKMVLMK
jgi:hypothetical protein